MALHAFNSNVLFSAPLELGIFDQVAIGNLGFVYSQGSVFTGTAGRNLISVAGTIAAGSTAFSFIGADPVEGGCNISVTQTGLISASFGIEYSGSYLSVSNAGAIHASFSAIDLDGGVSYSTHSVINSGTISASFAIRGDATLLSNLRVVNNGEMIGTGGWAILLEDGSSASDVVVNNGLMDGDVILGGGADLYDGRGGGSVLGVIGGGAGSDRMRPGLAEENFDGGSGSDLLDFRAGGGTVEIALDNAWEAGGWAEGDSWTGIENVNGSGKADRIGGDSAANRLVGYAGADTISGGSGADQIEGGSGKDNMSGGIGNDSFVLRKLGEIGDVVTDFSSLAPGDDDRFLISASGFGGGLIAGALAGGRFRSRADNAAQDADDRVIFRTTDQTLWYDQDGTGAEFAVMVADLQAGASMTFADIVIF